MCLLWEGLERNRLLHWPFPGLPSLHPCLPWPGRTASWQVDSSEGCVCFCDYHPRLTKKEGALLREGKVSRPQSHSVWPYPSGFRPPPSSSLPCTPTSQLWLLGYH